MARLLRDFRIEHENLILLCFTDGGQVRVAPNELGQHLLAADIERIQRSLRLRNQFLKSILPPTVLALLIASVVVLGGYDMYQVAQKIKNRYVPKPIPMAQPAGLSQGAPGSDRASGAGATSKLTAPAGTPAASRGARPVPASASPHRLQGKTSGSLTPSAVTAPLAPVVHSTVVTLQSAAKTVKKTTSLSNLP